MPIVTFLGNHMIDESGRYPCVEKVKVLMEKDYPKSDTTPVRSFIGMTLYYRNYTIPNVVLKSDEVPKYLVMSNEVRAVDHASS